MIVNRFTQAGKRYSHSKTPLHAFPHLPDSLYSPIMHRVVYIWRAAASHYFSPCVRNFFVVITVRTKLECVYKCNDWWPKMSCVPDVCGHGKDMAGPHGMLQDVKKLLCP